MERADVWMLFTSQLLGGGGPGGRLRPCVAIARVPSRIVGGGVSGIWRMCFREGWTV